MPRALVLCADGTCNAFGYRSSNVARLIEFLDLADSTVQLACYDQGIGTSLKQYDRICDFRAGLTDRHALWPLPPPREAWSRPWTWRFLIGSMMFGWGLDVNVRQLYVKLAELHQPDDQLFLFGFSRGAFTVRALAGLMWRYGMPPDGNRDRAGALFDRAWPLFKSEFPDEDGRKAAAARRFFDDNHMRCGPIHFLGIWDTVKSYGGLTPVMLPHLRHNPSVTFVRHALALDERRGWFDATTWGWLDSDRTRKAAASRLEPTALEAIENQKVVEVWFKGCHADVGGGAGNEKTADVALRWMLGEAADLGLRLNAAGQRFRAAPRESEHPTVDESRRLFWKAIERYPRAAINNSCRWPFTERAPKGAARRFPFCHPRDGTVRIHESVEPSVLGPVPTGVTLRVAHTSRRGAAQ